MSEMGTQPGTKKKGPKENPMQRKPKETQKEPKRAKGTLPQKKQRATQKTYTYGIPEDRRLHP